MKYNNFHLNVRGYRTIPSYSNKTLEDARHYPSSIKEWSDSTYAFNKSYVKDSHNNSTLANKVIKSYFNMDKISLSTKSKRMRDLLKRRSTKQIFVSKSLTKQTHDKVIVNLFVFDRLKKKFNKRLFFFKNNLNNLLNNNITKRRVKRKQHRKIISRHCVNFNTYPGLLSSSFLNKKYNLKALFFFYFLKWSLSAFNIKSIFLKKGDKLTQSNVIRIVNSNVFIIFSQSYAGTRIIKNTSKVLNLNSKEYYKILNLKDKSTIKNIYLINDILYKYLHILITKSLSDDGQQIKDKIYLLFKFFKNKNYKIFIKKFLRKEYMTLYYLYKLYVNKVKINELLPGLRYILSQIYNKKIELNIINLKYLHLNSDIFTNAIVVKLKKKTSRLLRVLKKSLKLVKMPQKMRTDYAVPRNSKFLNVNKLYTGVNIQSLYNLTKRSVSNSLSIKDRFNSLLSDMFYNSNDKLNLHNNVITSLKYKWITGVRLEAKGRLTKRFTASRSLFKFKYKGNLKNMDYLNKSVSNSMIGINRTSSLHMIRNELKPNIQYTATSSKKRIGTFGIKGWISNN